ncbi:MAG TPA: GNAT family N-acetyltransferase [Candidatus Limnocylindria bacterium]|nr:GNAT family N-acetyltransferase [Candidatus Limnocylindria bacterium]
METTMTGFEAITDTLPKGYRTREFRDADREPWVEERNAQVHELQRGTADEWREWEQIDPPKNLLRVSVDAADGRLAAGADLGPGSFPRADGTLFGGLNVMRAHRRKGLGTALLDALETEARKAKAPRILAGTSAAFEGSLEWAQKHGYKEIGRRLESYVDVKTFDGRALRDVVERVETSGIRLATVTEFLRGRDEAAIERFWRDLWEAEAPMWDDVPWASPTPHWPYEKFKKIAVDSGKLVKEATIVAVDGERIAALTTTAKQGTDRGYTWMTGTGRDYRGRGLATALKVKMLAAAKAAGLRAMLTTNDEPNKAMRGINAKLGYVMLPAHIELERTL